MNIWLCRASSAAQTVVRDDVGTPFLHTARLRKQRSLVLEMGGKRWALRKKICTGGRTLLSFSFREREQGKDWKEDRGGGGGERGEIVRHSVIF